MPEFTMQAVSTETGVPGDTLRSWERRYGFPSPSRDESNYRIYTERDLVAVAWLRDQTDRGQGISEAIGILRRILDSPQDDASPTPGTPPLTPVSTLTDALLSGDLEAAQVSWDGLAAAMSPDGLLGQILLPAHARVGDASLSLTDRLRADAFLLRKSIVLLDAASPDRGSRDVAVLLLGARSSVPAHALATVLARDRYRIALPVADLADAAIFAALRDLPPGTPVIVVTDRTDDTLLDALTPQGVRLWWPVPSAEREGDRWLPHMLEGARNAFADPA